MIKTKYIIPVMKLVSSLGVMIATIYRQCTGQGSELSTAIFVAASVNTISSVEEIYKKYHEPVSVLTANPPSTHFRDMVRCPSNDSIQRGMSV